MQELGAKPGVLQASAGLRPKATGEMVDSETSKASTCPARGLLPRQCQLLPFWQQIGAVPCMCSLLSSQPALGCNQLWSQGSC